MANGQSITAENGKANWKNNRAATKELTCSTSDQLQKKQKHNETTQTVPVISNRLTRSPFAKNSERPRMQQMNITKTIDPLFMQTMNQHSDKRNQTTEWTNDYGNNIENNIKTTNNYGLQSSKKKKPSGKHCRHNSTYQMDQNETENWFQHEQANVTTNKGNEPNVKIDHGQTITAKRAGKAEMCSNLNHANQSNETKIAPRKAQRREKDQQNTTKSLRTNTTGPRSNVPKPNLWMDKRLRAKPRENPTMRNTNTTHEQLTVRDKTRRSEPRNASVSVQRQHKIGYSKKKQHGKSKDNLSVMDRRWQLRKTQKENELIDHKEANSGSIASKQNPIWSPTQNSGTKNKFLNTTKMKAVKVHGRPARYDSTETTYAIHNVKESNTEMIQISCQTMRQTNNKTPPNLGMGKRLRTEFKRYES